MQFTKTAVEIIIYPEIVSFNRPLTHGTTGGPTPVSNMVYEDHNQYRGMRDYVPGDPLRTINWKASARFSTLQTMEYSNTLSAPACILLDLTAAGYPAKHRNAWIERAVSLTASLTAFYISTGQPMGLLANGAPVSAAENDTHVTISSGYAQADAILSALAPIAVCEKPDEVLTNFLKVYDSSGRNMKIFYIDWFYCWYSTLFHPLVMLLTNVPSWRKPRRISLSSV
ncbi:MAG: DUF58 domain-containing protein [Spirochaetes bacterium]|nr:DUF58 domain-containing protein [Spirochaetota bacterium]